MYSEENKSSALAKFLSVYDYVFVDTCSLMEDSFPTFMDTLTASKEYWKDGLSVIVIGECVLELQKHSKNKESQEARIEAKRALKILHHDKWHKKTITVTKPSTNDGFADHALFTQVSSLRIQNKILIITQDKTLATDLRKLNALDSQHGRYLAVYRLNQNGELEENPGETGNAYHKESVRPSASNSRYEHAERPTRSFTHERPRYEKKREEEEKPAEVESPIAQADCRLCANLLNPNYPTEKKINDINTQLGLLAQVAPADLEKMSLAYTIEQLKAELTKLGSKPAPVAVKPAPAVVKEEAKPVVKPVEAKPSAPAPKAEVKPIEAAKPRGWFEYGRTVQEGIEKCGSHYGYMFRDPSIPFVKGVHGSVDLTTADAAKAAQAIGELKAGESKTVPLASFQVYAEKTERDYKVSFILGEAKPAQKAPEISKKPAEVAPIVVVAAPKKEPAPAPKEPAPAPAKKASEPVKRRTHEKAATAKPAATKPSTVSTPDNQTAVPSGASLVVAVPEAGKKAFIERKSRREDNAPVSIVRAPGKAPKAKPAEKVSAKPTPKKPAAPKAPATKPVAKKPAAVKAAKPADKVTSSDAELAKKADLRLNANLHNPNYPKENKIKDLLAQEALLKKIPAKDRGGLLYSLEAIQAQLAELKKA